MCKKYSAKEKESFLRQLKYKSADKVRIRGRKKEHIIRRAREMGLTVKRITFPPLTRAQHKKLRQLIAEGYSSSQIADGQMLGIEKFPRNENNIRKWMGRLSLVNKNRSRAAKKRKIFTPQESAALNKFLRLHSNEFSARQIARKFGVKRATINARQRQLGVKPAFAVVLRIPNTRRRFKAGMRKRSKILLAQFGSKIAQREKELADLYKSMISKNDKKEVPLEERICKVCKKKLLKHPKFFYHNEVKYDGCSLWHFSNTCVICEAKKRHQKRLKKNKS